MEYNYLGNTGLRVSNLCLGTMTFGKNPEDCSEEVAHQILDEFVAKGGNFIDTADIYNFGLSEEILGRWLVKQPKRNRIILSTKLMSPMDIGDPNCQGLSRHHILQNIERSLKRLQTDYVDILFVHMWDESTPIEETLSALTDLVRAGKVHYIGASNFTGWQLQLSADVSKRLFLERFSCAQMQYSLLVRDIEFEITDVCKREGVGLLPWSPLKGGWLSGKMVREAGKAPEGSRVAIYSEEGRIATQARPSWKMMASEERTWDVIDTCTKIARNNNKYVAQVALRWLLQKENVPSVVIGVKSMAQLTDNLGVNGWKLSGDEMKDLDQVSEVALPYPYEMISRLSKGRVRKSRYC